MWAKYPKRIPAKIPDRNDSYSTRANILRTTNIGNASHYTGFGERLDPTNKPRSKSELPSKESFNPAFSPLYVAH